MSVVIVEAIKIFGRGLWILGVLLYNVQLHFGHILGVALRSYDRRAASIIWYLL